MSRAWLGIGTLALHGLLCSPLAAQGPGRSDLFAFQALHSAQDVQPEVQDEGVTFLGTAKWAGLAIAGGAAIYGFSLNSQADEVFDELDAICLDDPDRCDLRNPDGSFADEDLERLYQATVAKDREARTALIISQVTLATAVVFFIMDLSNRPRDNIPYDPPVALEVRPSMHGQVTLGARVRVGRGALP
jgi:hypothetical protein